MLHNRESLVIARIFFWFLNQTNCKNISLKQLGKFKHEFGIKLFKNTLLFLLGVILTWVFIWMFILSVYIFYKFLLMT